MQKTRFSGAFSENGPHKYRLNGIKETERILDVETRIPGGPHPDFPLGVQHADQPDRKAPGSGVYDCGGGGSSGRASDDSGGKEDEAYRKFHARISGELHVGQEKNLMLSAVYLIRNADSATWPVGRWRNFLYLQHSKIDVL